jgi:hypothetical protein
MIQMSSNSIWGNFKIHPRAFFVASFVADLAK